MTLSDLSQNNKVVIVNEKIKHIQRTIEQLNIRHDKLNYT